MACHFLNTTYDKVQSDRVTSSFCAIKEIFMFNVKNTPDEFGLLQVDAINAAQPVRELTIDESLAVAGGIDAQANTVKSIGN